MRNASLPAWSHQTHILEELILAERPHQPQNSYRHVIREKYASLVGVDQQIPLLFHRISVIQFKRDAKLRLHVSKGSECECYQRV